MLWTAAFWKGATERAAKTFAQALGAALVAAEVVGLFDIAWGDMLSVAGLAAFLSLLTSVSSPTFTAGDVPPGPGKRRAADPTPALSPDEMGG